jgi:hypothetical protein
MPLLQRAYSSFLMLTVSSQRILISFSFVLVNFVLLWQSIRNYQLIKKKGLFRMVFKVSVCGCLALWIQCTSPQECVASSSHGSWEAKEKERRVWVPYIPFKGTLPVTWLPSTRPHILKFPQPPNSTTGCGQSFNTWAFGGH